MPPEAQTPDEVEGVTALYRRFRPGRFAELRGQEHVVRALQGAVRTDRVSHAYLFSGPRGTGKTTTARILAKALNCASPLDGDACGRCASCQAIGLGASLDVVELDAASNNGVDDIRDIVAGAWHGTPGAWKVYIVDEVHQLSKAASAALLKTLEEPPAHVVFVLATTDAHKVLPTIRSRTQHLDFRLFTGETLAGLLRDVGEAAALAVDDATIDAAVRLGRGSARDALSALDQLIATGSLDESRPAFDGLFAALGADNAVAALESLALLAREGWDAEQLAESFAGEVRQVFLLLVAPDVADAVGADRERLIEWGETLGLARSVRVLESLGRAIREMRSAPEKLMALEVALVRLTRPDLDHTYEAIDERLSRLERAEPRPAATPPPPRPPIGAAVSVAPPPLADAPASTAPADESPAPSPTALTVPTARPDAASLEDVRARFHELVVPRTSRSAQLLLRSARVESLDGLVITIAVATDEMRQNTELISQGLKGALEHEFHATLTPVWTVDPTLALEAPVPLRARVRVPVVIEDVDDLDDASNAIDDDATAIVVDSVADHLITEMFPGAREIT